MLSVPKKIPPLHKKIFTTEKKNTKNNSFIYISGSILFFVIADLALIDPMYQFSLSYFKRLFSLVIETAEKSSDVVRRVEILIDSSTITIFLNVCRGLFNDHKKIFSFLVATSIGLKNHSVSKIEWSIFNRGVAFSKDQPPALPQGSKLNPKQWKQLCDLKQAGEVFATLPSDVVKFHKQW